MNSNLSIDCSRVAFCAGPCTSIVEEEGERKWLKPYSGGRYTKFTWETSAEVLVNLRNLRICSSCFDRYKEMWDGVSNFDADDIERMYRDADAILAKHGPTNKKG